MTLQRAGSQLEALRNAASARLDSLGRKNSARIIFTDISGIIGKKILLLKSALGNAKTPEEVGKVLQQAGAVERQIDGTEGAPRITLLKYGKGRSNVSVPFFDYLLDEEMPEGFSARALAFRDRIGEFGVSLSVDCGVVYARKNSGEVLAGHVLRTFFSTPSLHSEYPGWKRRGNGGSAEGVSCSIKLDNLSLGVTGGLAKFVESRLDRAEHFSRFAYISMQQRYFVRGFALELNQDGERLHIYLGSPGGEAVATLFKGKLEIPPQAWQHSTHQYN